MPWSTQSIDTSPILLNRLKKVLKTAREDGMYYFMFLLIAGRINLIII